MNVIWMRRLILGGFKAVGADRGVSVSKGMRVAGWPPLLKGDGTRRTEGVALS